MNAAWPLVRLGELLTKSEDWITLEPDARYREVTVRLWGKGVVLRGEVSGAEITAKSRLRVRTDQFIFSRIDARNGAIGIVPTSLDGAVVSSDFPVFHIDRNRLLAAFLGWMSKTAPFVNRCRAASEGTTNRIRLKENRFLKVEIPLPPLAEQRRIVAKIDAVASKVQEAQSLRRQAAEESASLVTSIHVTAAGSRAVVMGDILRLDEHQEHIEAGREYPQVGILGFGGGLFAKPAVTGGQTTYKTFNRLYDGALVLSQVKGWEGAIAVCPPEFAGRYASPEYRTFRCTDQQVLPEYLASIVVTPWFCAKLKTLTRGVGARRERIRPEHFLSLRVPMPTVEKQKALIPALASLRPLKVLCTQTAAELDALLPAILDRAFKGEL